MSELKVTYKVPSTTEKSFPVKVSCKGGMLYLKADYDDVSREEARAMLQVMSRVLEENWDQDAYNNLIVKEYRRTWESDKYLREDYDQDYEAYLKDCGII